MKILITGAGGQLGRALLRQADRCHEVRGLTREDLDITDPQAVTACMRAFVPDAVINAAAYTSVDGAESERELATRVNTDAPGYLAASVAAAGARLIHVSTDFVFNGEACHPYPPEASTNPLGVYGRTKRDGELRAFDNAGERATVVRTAWVYGPDGNNFVRTMLRLLSEKPELSVVSDQIGAPTHTTGLASALLRLAEGGLGKGEILHWTDSGVASWYDLAETVRLAAQRRWPERSLGTIVPISTAEWPTPAKRPRFSVLDTSTMRALVGTPPSWQDRLDKAFAGERADEWLA